MRLFEPRVWTVWDIGCLKWSSILFGAVLGAYFSTFVLTYLWLFVIGFVLFAIRPTMVYFGPERPHGGQTHSTPGTIS